MNAKIKSLFLLFAITTLSTLVSCEKDLYEESIQPSQKAVKTEFVTGNEARLIISKLEKKLKTKYSVISSNMEGRITMASIGTVLYDEIVKATDSNGNSTYTFKVNHPDASFDKFYNLILSEQSNGTIVKLLEYKMTEEFAEQFLSSYNYKNFQGTLKTYTISNDTPCDDQDVILFAVGNVSDPSENPNSPPGGGTPPSGNPPSSTPPSSTPPGGPPPGAPSGTPPSGTPPGGSTSSSSGHGTASSFAAYIEMVIDCISSGGTWYVPTGSCIADPRFFKIGMPTTTEPGTEPCNPMTYVVVITPATKCEKQFMQSTPFLNWIGQNQGNYQYSQIMNYINGNNSGECSSQKEIFINEMLNAIINDSCTIFKPNMLDDQITTSLPPCLDQVVNNIKTLQNGKFGKVIAQFAGTNPLPLNYNWHIKTASLSTNPVKAAETSFISGVGATTTLNSNYINVSTDLSIAKTLIHECFHAYLCSVFRYKNIPNENYVTLINTYAIQFNNNLNDLHHHVYTMSNIISQISLALKEYGTSKGYNLPQQFYDDMAWGGLLGTTPFNALPISDKERIISTIEAEFENSNQNYLQISPRGIQICP